MADLTPIISLAFNRASFEATRVQKSPSSVSRKIRWSWASSFSMWPVYHLKKDTMCFVAGEGHANDCLMQEHKNDIWTYHACQALCTTHHCPLSNISFQYRRSSSMARGFSGVDRGWRCCVNVRHLLLFLGSDPDPFLHTCLAFHAYPPGIHFLWASSSSGHLYPLGIPFLWDSPSSRNLHPLGISILWESTHTGHPQGITFLWESPSSSGNLLPLGDPLLEHFLLLGISILWESPPSGHHLLGPVLPDLAISVLWTFTFSMLTHLGFPTWVQIPLICICRRRSWGRLSYVGSEHENDIWTYLARQALCTTHQNDYESMCRPLVMIFGVTRPPHQQAISGTAYVNYH